MHQDVGARIQNGIDLMQLHHLNVWAYAKVCQLIQKENSCDLGISNLKWRSNSMNLIYKNPQTGGVLHRLVWRVVKKVPLAIQVM